MHLPAPIDDGLVMDTDPAALPEMHFYAREFRYKDINLGETRLEAFPLNNGLRIESLEAVSPQFNFQLIFIPSVIGVE